MKNLLITIGMTLAAMTLSMAATVLVAFSCKAIIRTLRQGVMAVSKAFLALAINPKLRFAQLSPSIWLRIR